MARALTGFLRGTTITLDRGVPPLDGRRVRVVVEAEASSAPSSPVDNRGLWVEWVARGPQGPLDDLDDDFPDEA